MDTLDTIMVQHHRVRTEIKASNIEEIEEPRSDFRNGALLFLDNLDQNQRLLGLDLGKRRKDLQRVVMNDSNLVCFRQCRISVDDWKQVVRGSAKVQL